jgi:hypothetical protein
MRRRIQCQSVCAIMQMDDVEYFVCIRLLLLYDYQNPGFSSRVDAMQFGVERHGVGRFADRDGSDNAMLVQVEDRQHGICVTSDEQPAADLIDRHSRGRLATLQPPAFHDGAFCDVDGNYRAGIVQILV